MNTTHQNDNGRKPSVFLFDLDGTLVDSYQAICDSVNHVRGKYDLPPMTLQQIRTTVGNGLIHLLKLTVPHGELETNRVWFEEHHPTVLQSGTKILPKVEEMLKQLKEQGAKLAICSNKPIAMTKHVMGLIGLDRYFDELLGPELVENRKPAPDMLMEAMRRFNVTAAETLYIGDMVIDIRTARAAGVPVYVVATGSDTVETLRAAEPDRLLENFDELCEFVAN